MYAVMVSGGKQYRVQPGDIVQIEKLEGDVGASVRFDQVLLCAQPTGEQSQIWLGRPNLAGAMVEGEIVGQGRGDKILIVKMKRRKQYRRTQGHRQFYTQVLVTGLSNGSGEKAALSAEEKSARLTRFQSHLKPVGLAHSPKILGSRKRRAAARTQGETPAQATAAAETAATGKKTAAPKKKAAPKAKASK